MRREIFYLFILFICASASLRSQSRSIDSVLFSINSRYSFYSSGKSGEMLLHVPSGFIWTSLKIDLVVDCDTLYSSSLVPGRKIARLPFTTDLGPGIYRVSAHISVPGRKIRYIASAGLRILPYKPNEVKTDNLTGGLIVNKRKFFPFGFYCYSPVHPALPEEEAVKGFNMISPYQKIVPGTMHERKAYMDRCARLGMKVNYNLLSVAGGGGVNSQIEDLTADEKRERLIKEIRTFMDHPALLAWYIADEPNGYRIPPAEIEEIYNTVKETDPWHPVSVVFMAPFMSAVRYAGGLDIVMADPYPVPDSRITLPGTVARQLSGEFAGKKPVWIAPQAFGGGELWSREPTIQEMRTMTYQAIINGARGIQYFVRQGLNLFPKSVAAWNECGRMALEIAVLTPWLLSDEPSPAVQSGSSDIQVASAMQDEQLLIMAVNISNRPLRAEIKISANHNGRARVLFENRFTTVNSGTISDQISAYGSQVYLIDLRKTEDGMKSYPGNLLRDPGFEDISSPGIPASCYAWNQGDRGATFFLDTREKVEGNNSLRLITPVDNKSARLRFFPVNVTKGRTYMVSVWAKADPEQRPGKSGLFEAIHGSAGSPIPQYFELSIGDYGRRRFIPGDEWHQFITAIRIPVDEDVPPKLNLILSMPGSGTAWFDMLQVFEAVELVRSINPEIRSEW